MSYNVIHEFSGGRSVPTFRIEAVEWDEANEVHATRHGVSINEIEDALSGAVVAHRNKRDRAGDWYIEERTRGGRAVHVVFRYRVETHTARPITAWEVER
jgi:uncharacterized DUF497 family protein